jgi:predicted HicB family RNase H-like nuclease
MSVTVPRVNIEVPDELHTRAKLCAVKKGITLKAAVIEALEVWVLHAEQGDGEPPRRRGQR